MVPETTVQMEGCIATIKHQIRNPGTLGISSQYHCASSRKSGEPLNLTGPRWECNLNGTSSDLQEKWELQGKGLLSGKPHIKLRGRNIEIPDFTDEKALKGLPRFSGKVDFQAELQGPEGWKGKAEAGKLISSLFPAEKKGNLTDALKGEWNDMNVAFSQKGDAPLELNGEALHSFMGKILFKGKMGKASWEMTFSSRQDILRHPYLHGAGAPPQEKR